jgi:hypothetical protein
MARLWCERAPAIDPVALVGKFTSEKDAVEWQGGDRRGSPHR